MGIICVSAITCVHFFPCCLHVNEKRMLAIKSDFFIRVSVVRDSCITIIFPVIKTKRHKFYFILLNVFSMFWHIFCVNLTTLILFNPQTGTSHTLQTFIWFYNFLIVITHIQTKSAAEFSICPHVFVCASSSFTSFAPMTLEPNPSSGG